MASNATPVPGPYNSYTPISYHASAPSTYNRSILATGPYYATSSYNKYPEAFFISGSSAATVTLINGGQIQIEAPAATAPKQIFDMSVYSVDAGTVYLLYRS